MTNEEAVAEAKRIEESIEARILAGEIPPRPEGAIGPWFAKHLACVVHRYHVRERGGDRCAECVRRGHHSGVRYEVVRYEAMTLPEFAHVEQTITTPLPPKRTPRRLQ